MRNWVRISFWDRIDVLLPLTHRTPSNDNCAKQGASRDGRRRGRTLWLFRLAIFSAYRSAYE